MILDLSIRPRPAPPDPGPSRPPATAPGPPAPAPDAAASFAPLRENPEDPEEPDDDGAAPDLFPEAKRMRLFLEENELVDAATRKPSSPPRPPKPMISSDSGTTDVAANLPFAVPVFRPPRPPPRVSPGLFSDIGGIKGFYETYLKKPFPSARTQNPAPRPPTARCSSSPTTEGSMPACRSA